MNLFDAHAEDPTQPVEEAQFEDIRALPFNEPFSRVANGEITNLRFISKYPNTDAFIAIRCDHAFKAEVYSRSHFNRESKFYFGYIIDKDANE